MTARSDSLVASALICGAALLLAPSFAGADDRTDGKDLKARLPLVATVEGAWSTTLTAGLLASGRLLAPPIEEGLLDVVATRVLYGTSFSVSLVTVATLSEAIAGDWGWVERAEYETSWLAGFDVPGGCSGLGTPAGCGLGLGTSSEVHGMWSTAPVGLGLTMGAEWIQGRVDRDGARTLVESSWVLSPIGLRVELPLGDRDVHVVPGVGAGVYGGLHNAHLHRESQVEVAPSPFELVPLHGGVGPGLAPDLQLTLFRRVRFDGSVALAPFLLGDGRDGDIPFATTLNDPSPDGIVTWRRATASVTVRPSGFPVWVGLRYWTGELSRRPVTRAGHQAVSVAFEVPLRE